MVRIVRCLRFVKQIGTEIKPVLDQLEIGIDLELQFEICDMLAAGLIASPPFGFCRKSNRKWRRRTAIEQQIAHLAEEPAERNLAAVVHVRYVFNAVP